jgi:hypothetical protein
MLFLEHVVSALLVGCVCALFLPSELGVYLVGGMVVGQFIDVDHYYGSLTMLVRCGLVLSQSDPLWQTCSSQMVRGIFHQWMVVVLLTGYLGAVGGVLAARGHRRSVCWLCGFYLGYLLHLFLDFWGASILARAFTG